MNKLFLQSQLIGKPVSDNKLSFFVSYVTADLIFNEEQEQCVLSLLLND